MQKCEADDVLCCVMQNLRNLAGESVENIYFSNFFNKRNMIDSQ